MDSDKLKALQAPLKDRYRMEPASAVITLKAEGRLGEGVSCSLQTHKALVEAGLHPATGGNGLEACSWHIGRRPRSPRRLSRHSPALRSNRRSVRRAESNAGQTNGAILRGLPDGSPGHGG